MKNNALPEDVRQKIEEIKTNLLPQASIPNSRLFKKIDLIEAEAVLQYAKSLNRPVRKALATECESSRNIHKRENTYKSPKDYLSSSQVAEMLGMKESTVLFYHRKKAIIGTKIKKRIYFEKAEIYRFQASRAAKKLSL